MSVERAEPSRAPADDAVSVRPLSHTDRDAWDRFVTMNPAGTFFHLSGWRRVIEDVCGHRTHYLCAARGAEIVGVLPLAEIKSRLFGHSLISTPFCVYGGAVGETLQVRHALESRARDIADDLNVDYLELRNVTPSEGEWGGKQLYVTFRKKITANDDENMKAIPRKQRAMVRKGIEAGLTAETDADTDRFYAMYSESVRNLGTPVLSRTFFRTLFEEFAGAVDVTTIRFDGHAISSVMTFYFRNEVLPYYGGGTAAARDAKANDFMYWALMSRSAARGYSLFDFGRSKIGTGSYSFKKNWGFEAEDLPYQYHLVRAAAVPDVSPLNPKYRLLIGTWKRMPLWLTQALGPLVARNLG